MAETIDDARAIGFDLGDTLCEYAGVPLSWEDEYPAALAAIARTCGCALTGDLLETGIRVLLKHNTRRFPREIEFPAAHIFGELLSAWNAPLECLDGAIATFFQHFRQTLRAFPDSLRVVRALQLRGVAVGVLTDVPYGMPRSLVLDDVAATELAVDADRVVTSVDVGRRKPHIAGFVALAAALGVPCERLTYVGNERKDVSGGNSAGCRTVLVWRSTTAAPEWGQNFTIRSLDDLPELMDP